MSFYEGNIEYQLVMRSSSNYYSASVYGRVCKVGKDSNGTEFVSVGFCDSGLEYELDEFVGAGLYIAPPTEFEGTGLTLIVECFTASQTGKPAAVLYSTSSAEEIGRVTFSSKYQSQTISMTKAQGDNIIKYGLRIKANSPARGNYLSTKPSFDYRYTSYYAPPIIDFANREDGNGWWFPKFYPAEVSKAIEKPFEIALKYEQEKGQANTGYTVTMAKYTGDGTTTSSSDWSAPETIMTDVMPTDGKITIPTQYWQKLTERAPNLFYGADGRAYNYIQLKITAKSAKGAVSIPLTVQSKNYLKELEVLKPLKDSVQITNAPMKIKWQLNGESYLSTPSGFDLEVSYDGGATWTVVVSNISGTLTEYTLPSETIGLGAVRWRMRQKFVDNTIVQPFTSAKSESKFTGRANPTTSGVSSDGKPQPTVSWTSSEQKSYQVRFGDYDSGAVYSAAKSHTIPRFFADGNYPVQVRTQVASGEWSDWSETIYVAITNTPPDDAITLTAERDGDAVKLVWSCTYDSTYIQYIVYRGGVPIHKTDGGKKLAGFVDNLAVGKSAYFVRGITATKNYYQSETKTVDATPVTDLLYDVDAGTYIRLRYTVSSPTTVTYSRQIGVSYQYFAGRSEPVAIVNGRIERSTTQTYGSRTRELADKIDAMTGRTVLFRDTRGGGIYGVIEQVQTVHGRIHSVTFTVREVYHNERVEYTVPGS